MGEGEDDWTEASPPRRVAGWRRRQRVALLVGGTLFVGLAGLWIERKPIAGRVIDSELGKRGVVARYDVHDLGFGRQRLTHVVIGDPRDPDLVADWLETRTRIGLDGAQLTGVRAGHVRLRARMVDGRVTLGEIDKLLPAPSGKPFALPALDVALADARLRLETPYGVAGLRLAGRGRLDGGFAGTLAVVSDGLAQGGCGAQGVRAALKVSVTAAAPRLSGPVQVAAVRCAGVTLARSGASVDVRLSPALDGWRGDLRLASGAIAGAGARSAGIDGTIRFAGSAKATEGAVDLVARQATVAPLQAGRAAIRGRYRLGEQQAFTGSVAVQGAVIDADRLPAPVAAAGTPVAPLLAAATQALRRAAQGFDGKADVRLVQANGRGQARVTAATARAASGARIDLNGGSGVSIGWPGMPLRLDTRLALQGGGLPNAQVALSQPKPGGAISGRAVIAPYAAGAARVALAPVLFRTMPGGATQVTTRATLSGPLGDGRVDGLALPLDLRWQRGRLVANPGCTPLAIARLAIAGLVLDPLRSELCALSGGLVTLDRGALTGGARLPATRLTGRLGTTPISVAASGAEVHLADRGFTLTSVAARLGAPERVTRIDLAALTGRITAGGVAGQFTGGAGQIANVPLLLGAAAGDWSLRKGALNLAATMTVDDAAPDPRFKTLAARDVTLSLIDGAIAARGTLFEPTADVKVADVTIDHRLASGQGKADIAVPGITFTKTFQPDLLTRLTFGVVADVRGTVSGEGHIGWDAAGVRSTGRFATKDTDLAAAFGPVTGISTTLTFTDLLNLVSAPAQVATIKTVNPGIAVTDGTIVYRLLPDLQVGIDGGRWPFAGGTMTLLPTTLDFTETAARRLTFRIEGAAADQFLEQFDFKNLTATGVFDGELPMVFDAQGGRIEGGRLVVRQGGGSLAYVGDLSQKDLGLWGNIAFQALKSLRYRNLTIGMNGPLAGEMITEVRFAGVTQGQGAKSNFIVKRLQRLPFVFNIRIKAPFRGLLDSAQSFYDPSRLIQRNLPALLERQRQQEQQGAPIQPSASATVPQAKQD
ncbi:YdbH domain-containing protein [Sphingomonas sp. RIT328]|uniref:YdbH domain-containing protein n=1 Tax=Sphingomonas sp. RIT328 TaxID=1470591 RepID=UPI00044F273A|nr:YdbH domain-containing protein [Sphingomonas sp. RIT328]EZP52964.1 hypothetical protein BW41_02140 [Sphingomonas sp. RIT328]